MRLLLLLVHAMKKLDTAAILFAILVMLAIATPVRVAKKINWPYAIAIVVGVAILGLFAVQAVHPEWLK